MGSQITLTLPDEVLQRAESLARRTGRPVADVLADVIESSLRPLGAASGADESLADWSDADVLAAAEASLSAEEGERLSELLDRRQAGTVTDAERTEAAALMQRCQDGLLRKARALREAVRRELREPPQP